MYIDEIIIDTRVSKLNIFYLFNLKKKLKNLNFIKVYDLQNSSRTSFYRKFIINNSNFYTNFEKNNSIVILI